MILASLMLQIFATPNDYPSKVLLSVKTEQKRADSWEVRYCSITFGMTSRVILYQHRSKLKSIVAQGAGLCANPQADLDQVLESLYLEEVEVAEKVQQLEALTRRYKILTAQNSPTNDVIEVKRQIFWVLGLK